MKSFIKLSFFKWFFDGRHIRKENERVIYIEMGDKPLTEKPTHNNSFQLIRVFILYTKHKKNLSNSNWAITLRYSLKDECCRRSISKTKCGVPNSASNLTYWRLDFENPSINFQAMREQQTDIHTDIQTDRHTYRQTNGTTLLYIET